jgi:hypothetical protein
MTYLIAVAAAAVGALAQIVAHVIGWGRAWTRLVRYLIGATIANVATTAAFWLALPTEHAATASGLLWFVYGAAGLATWGCYEVRDRRLHHDRPDPTPDAARLLHQLNRELQSDDLSDEN